MKLLVVSDIHGSLFYTNKIIEIMNHEEVDKVILLGDLYYHGPRNPLPKDYNPMEVSKVLNSIKDKLICVKGNCDAEVDQMISEFKINDHAYLTLNNKKIMFTHGHKFNIDNKVENIDVLIYGHFHTGFIKEENNQYFINSGSITLPKNDTPNSYLIIENNNKKLTIKLMDIENNVIDILTL